MVERRICNPQVMGSSPLVSSTFSVLPTSSSNDSLGLDTVVKRRIAAARTSSGLLSAFSTSTFPKQSNRIGFGSGAELVERDADFESKATKTREGSLTLIFEAHLGSSLASRSARHGWRGTEAVKRGRL